MDKEVDTEQGYLSDYLSSDEDDCEAYDSDSDVIEDWYDHDEEYYEESDDWYEFLYRLFYGDDDSDDDDSDEEGSHSVEIE